MRIHSRLDPNKAVDPDKFSDLTKLINELENKLLVQTAQEGPLIGLTDQLMRSYNFSYYCYPALTAEQIDELKPLVLNVLQLANEISEDKLSWQDVERLKRLEKLFEFENVVTHQKTREPKIQAAPAPKKTEQSIAGSASTLFHRSPAAAAAPTPATVNPLVEGIKSLSIPDLNTWCRQLQSLMIDQDIDPFIHMLPPGSDERANQISEIRLRSPQTPFLQHAVLFLAFIEDRAVPPSVNTLELLMEHIKHEWLSGLPEGERNIHESQVFTDEFNTLLKGFSTQGVPDVGASNSGPSNC